MKDSTHPGARLGLRSLLKFHFLLPSRRREDSSVPQPFRRRLLDDSPESEAAGPDRPGGAEDDCSPGGFPGY